jgi:predicted nuclease of restriction endonuclease-like (RecB) superfamily
MSAHEVLPDDYDAVLAVLSARVRDSRFRAHLRVNVELTHLYWSIGRTLVEKQATGAWGTRVVDRVARDLQAEFPGMKGFSRTNLKYMRSFAKAWPASRAIGQQPVDQLPWGHITVLLSKLGDQATRDWYASRACEQGWSRDVLVNSIMSRAFERTGASLTNFDAHLTPADSDLARELARDPYVFDFLDVRGELSEREMEQGLIDRVADTLRELGTGFAFVGRQIRLTVDRADHYVDLLFFHVEQLRYVVVELKVGDFEPAFTGQLGFYVAVVEDTLRRHSHRPTVGILICAGRSEQTVRYALQSTGSPMAVSTYSYESLPADVRQALPSADRIIAAVGSRAGDGPSARIARAGADQPA